MDPVHFSEPGLVRLALSALQGSESALITIEKLSPLLLFTSADRTSHRIPSLWSRCSSTVALGRLLTSIGQFGCIICLLRRFVYYFTNSDFGGVRESKKNPESDAFNEGTCILTNLSLINQAFAITVGKVIEGYISALNTLSASVSLRRSSKTYDGGCLTGIGNSEITLLEVYLHTAGLRTQIEALGNVCKVNHLTGCFPVSSLEDLRTKADSEFIAFPRNGALLSFLYAQLKVADPDHCTLLKFLFLQSYEPYCGFIRSWIYDGTVNDPYHEFVVECISKNLVYSSAGSGIDSGSPLPIYRVKDGAALPCFLEECLVPLFRAGQQLQVVMKFLELSNNIGACDTWEEILPCLFGLSTKYPSFSVPLTFDKEPLEAMARVRASYYEKMLEKIEISTNKFDFNSLQSGSRSVQLRLLNHRGENLNRLAPYAGDKSSISPLTDRKNQSISENILDSETSSIIDDCPYAEDDLKLSECSSSEVSEDPDDAEKLTAECHSVEASYLSGLDLSSCLSSLLQNHCRSDNLYSVEDVSLNVNWKSVHAAYPLHNEIYIDQKLSRTPQTWTADNEDDVYPFDLDRRKLVKWLDDGGLEQTLKSCGLLNTDLDGSEIVSKGNQRNREHDQSLPCGSLETFHIQFPKLEYDSTFFNMNPTLNRSSFFPRAMPAEKDHAHCGSYFEFASVEDPVKACAVKLGGDYVPEYGNGPSDINEFPSSVIDTRNQAVVRNYNDIIIENNGRSCNASSPLHDNENKNESVLLPNICGGSLWETLLGRSDGIANRSIHNHRAKLVTGADLPLDFVIKKSVLDEILLQYNYLSKLIIKLLIDGFKLQEHLQALRCYHFMELADWADLFIMSLWHHKWHDTEVGKRLPEIQGVLELAIQRSSCEGDPNKHRLYVYLKGDDNAHSSASAMGIHSFDFLGLGYQVDWPVNIIVTPAALRIYSEIFNFLIQVKLALFSLSDAWTSLKGYHLDKYKGDPSHMSILTDTRHKVNHFVSALQQYVQMQLSQVSWYRFLHSIKHKVKDMFDLDSVHMAYLTESLHICFLSSETRSVACIVQNILQCALDFHSCLTGSILRASSDGKLLDKFSRLEISQVHSIRRTFIKNLAELYLIYLKSPKHSEIGLPRLWDYLNFNEYYTGVLHEQIGHLSVLLITYPGSGCR